MPLIPYGTRLPESKCSYLKMKALHTGKPQQQVLIEIIDAYQQNDKEFMALFEAMLASATSYQDKEVSNGV